MTQSNNPPPEIINNDINTTTAPTTPTETLVPQPPSYQHSQTNESNVSDGPTSIVLSLAEVLYSAASYHAIAKPVSLTMILAALATIFINTPQTISQGEAEMAQYYYAFHSSSDNPSNKENLALSVVNSLVIVAWIGAMTFVIVLLYKFRCMKCLIGYMIFSSSMLLGMLGGRMFYVAIDKYRIPIDTYSFYFILYNFALVGTIAIFYQTGIPLWITQGYLIMTSVILAWQFSHFDSFMTWTLLVMLALYDLCAVLTPCGPLKALVGLMQQDDSPDMPGLLYEAELPAGAERPGGGGRRRGGNGNGGNGNGQNGNSNRTNGNRTDQTADETVATASDTDGTLRSSEPPTPPPAAFTTPTPTPAVTTTPPPSGSILEMSPTDNTPTERTAILPLAIAKIYRLPIVTPSTPGMPHTTLHSNDATTVSTSPLLEDSAPPAPHTPPPDRDYTPAELKADVRVLLPANGGRIDKRMMEGQPRYVVTDRNGVRKRVLLIDRQGKVFEEVDDDDDDDGPLSNSIKLGLGDFIFYSVLVSKAASYSFTTFAACMLVILAGLGMTLVLLSVYHQALPALPISIFLGVIFYLLTRMVVEPWIEDLLYMPYYV